MNPFVFIVGCPRSGTTLLRRIVDAHPQIAITRETHWITKSISLATPEGDVTPELFGALRNDFRFTRLLPESEELESLLAADRPVAYSTFVTQIFDLYGKKQGKRLVGDKTPGYVRSLPTLHELWPEAKFVHLIRDGRDTALSLLDWSAGLVRHLPAWMKRRIRGSRTSSWWGGPPIRHLPAWKHDPMTTAALYWESLVRRGRADGASLERGLYFELQYEALVNRPEASCADLCEFLSVPFDDRMLRVPVRPVQSGRRDWRKEMSRDELERFEAAVGDLLEELGYPRAVPRPAAPAAANAAKVRRLFDPGTRV